LENSLERRKGGSWEDNIEVDLVEIGFGSGIISSARL
jgi:hypothetical protein